MSILLNLFKTAQTICVRVWVHIQCSYLPVWTFAFSVCTLTVPVIHFNTLGLSPLLGTSTAPRHPSGHVNVTYLPDKRRYMHMLLHDLHFHDLISLFYFCNLCSHITQTALFALWNVWVEATHTHRLIVELNSTHLTRAVFLECPPLRITLLRRLIEHPNICVMWSYNMATVYLWVLQTHGTQHGSPPDPGMQLSRGTKKKVLLVA